MRRVGPVTVAAVTAVCAVLLTSSCATEGGVQVEGPANQVKPPPPPPPPTSSGQAPSADPVAVVRADPQVGEKIRGLLKPCGDARYPVDSRYEDLTGDGKADLLVAVRVCPSASTQTRATVANYIYDLAPVPPKRLFGVEEPATTISVEPSVGFVLIRARYEPADRSCCPSGQEATLYRWNGTAFEEMK